jgi:spore coat polysaccharide biosynthesis protein SpsF
MDIGIFIQARMTSTRLPKKVMMDIYNGECMLGMVIERLKHCKMVGLIVVVTSINETDDIIEKWCNEKHIEVFRGDENNVLERYTLAVDKYKVNTVVRITADCPGIDPELVDEIIDYYNTRAYDYVSNTVYRTYPRGMDIEIFSTNVLKIANKEAKLEIEREHVTPYIYGSGKFTIGEYKFGYGDQYRFTVDTEQDIQIVRKVFSILGKYWKWTDLVQILKELDIKDETMKFESSEWYKKNKTP